MRRTALALLLGCLLLVAGASALDGYDYYQTIEYAGCDQDIYQQDIVIHRTTGTAYNETAGGLETWHIYVGEHCQEDYDDLRFTNSTGELAYYLWPDYDSSSARFCVRLEGADAAGVLQVWYGNSAATTTSSGKDTYFLFDHFEGTSIDTEIWQNTATGGTISVADSVLTISGNLGANKGLQSQTSFGPGTTFETSFKGTTATDGSLLVSYGLFRSGNYFSVVDVSSANNAVVFYAATPESNGNAITMSALFETLTLSRPATSSQRGSYRSTTSTFSKNIPDDLPIIIGAWAAGGVATCSFDYALVRAYSATPPAASTFSGEQEATGTLHAFPGIPRTPQDLNGDGLYTDINGNGRLDYNDLIIFFQHLTWAKTAQPTSCFDFNGNGWLDYNDVITLFSIITEEHP